jgi:predicted transcriptional regulator
MANMLSDLVIQLRQAGLSADEATLYAELVHAPATHLHLSRVTGMNRTKVYRVVASLEEQGLVIRRSDDRGTFLIAGDPISIEEMVAKREAKAAVQRTALERVKIMMPLFESSARSEFTIHTYEGVEGMKQMQWHELKTKDTLYALGFLTYEELVDSRRWAESFRERVAQAGYQTYEIISRLPKDYEPNFTDSEVFLQRYTGRTLSPSVLPIYAPMTIYNDTVAIYQVGQEHKFGTEIIHAGFAKTMRKMFEHYWELAKPLRPQR